MGFLDRAKKLAEQAQEKLDDAQKQFNERQDSSGGGAAGGGPAAEYDQHGRPVKPPETATPPHGDPLVETPPVNETPVETPPVNETPGVPRTEEDEPKPPPRAPSAPGMSSGDPLAG